MTRDEGILKFDCLWTQAAAPDAVQAQELVAVRNRLFELNLIGVYPGGIGFGNISQRCSPSALGGSASSFLISASQTGHIPNATASNFVIVDSYSIENNWVSCIGMQRASSESLTHAMVYETFPSAQAVIHVHNNAAWTRLQGLLPTTGRDVPYGTAAMARAVQLLADTGQLNTQPIFIMAGHEDGIVSFGTDLSQAFTTLIQTLDKFLT